MINDDIIERDWYFRIDDSDKWSYKYILLLPSHEAHEVR